MAVSLSIDCFSILVRIGRRNFLFWLPLSVWSVRNDIEVCCTIAIVILHSTHVYTVKKSAHSYSILRTCTKNNIYRMFCHFESCSIWVLFLANLIRNCRQYGHSFVLTSETTVAGDRVEYITPWGLFLAVLCIAFVRYLLFRTRFLANPWNNRLTGNIYSTDITMTALATRSSPSMLLG